MTTKWSYVPFYPGEPTRDPREPPVPPDYEHLVGLNPQKVAVIVTIYEGKARIQIAAPEDSAEQITNAYADAYAGSSLGDPTDSSPFYCSAVEETHHFIFRRNQNHDMPVRVFMRGPKGHSGWWSDPQPNGHDVEYRDVSSHLFEGVPALGKSAPKARVYLYFMMERVGPMEEKTSLRDLLGTPHKDRMRYLAEGKVWSVYDGWHVPAQPTSSAFALSTGMVVARPTQAPAQTDFRDIFTRRNASHSFYRVQVGGTVVTPIGDTASLDRAMEVLRTWARQARYLGVDMSDYDLWTPVVLQAPRLMRKEARKDWYDRLDRAVENCEFYPHGGNPVNRQDLTQLEGLVLKPLPWERRHKCLSYQPTAAGTTQTAPGGSTLHSPVRSPPREPRGKGPGGPLPLAGASAPSPSPVAPPGATAPSEISLVRVGKNPKDQVPVWLPDSIHTNFFGRSGSGKTVLVVNSVLGSFRASAGDPDSMDIVISSAGDIFQHIKGRLTVKESESVIEIDPATMVRDGRVAIGMNPLRIEEREHLSPDDLVRAQYTIRGDVSQIVSAKMGSREMGERIKRNFGGVIGSLLDIPELETTLYDAYQVLEGKGKTHARGEVARMVRNDDNRRYMVEGITNLEPLILQSSQNKASNFAHPHFRAALCQRGDGVVTMHQLMSENKMILINLRLEQLTKEVSEYMGSAYLTMIYLAALRHHEENPRRIIRIWVDEWPDIASESFSPMLRTGRKYGIRLRLATQAIGNIPDGKDGTLDLLSQVTGNVDTWVCFQTDEDTARFVNQYARLERFGFDYRHYLNWPKYYAGVVHGNEYADMVTDPLPPAQPEEVRTRVEAIIQRNTWRYAKVDNSAESPFKIGKVAELDVLEAFAKHGTMTRDQAILHVPQHRSVVWPVIDNLEKYHFLVKHRDAGKKERYQITALGLKELQKYGRTIPTAPPRGNFKMEGGPDHDRTLERARVHLQGKGLQVGPKIAQVTGVPNPDFTHTLEDGTTVLDEVEDGASHPDTILSHYERARGNPVWFWATDIDTARRIVNTLGDRPNCLLFVDQDGSFSRYGPGVPKEEEPITEEQELVEYAIIDLIEKKRYFITEKRRAFNFKDIVQSLSKPLPYQKVRAILDMMVGDTIHAIRERRSELGGPIVILNDLPSEDPVAEVKRPAEAPEGRVSKESTTPDDFQMVFDTCVALSHAGKTFVHRHRGERISLHYSDVYHALPIRISLARFKEVVAAMLQQDEFSELIPRHTGTAILVIDPPDTGVVDNARALECSPEELYLGLQPTALAREKNEHKASSAAAPTAPQPSAVGTPLPASPQPGQPLSLPGQSRSGGKEEIWEVSLRTAREKWQKRQKSFLLKDGLRVAVKFDTLHGVVKSALVRGGGVTNLNADLLVQVLKAHGVEVESLPPPPHWTQTWKEPFCLFPLAMLQIPPESSTGSQAARKDVDNPSSESGTPEPAKPVSASQGLHIPVVPGTGPAQTNGPELMKRDLRDKADLLLKQGKALTIDGKKAVRVSDLCAFYPPWTERKMGLHLDLLEIETVRIWIPVEKARVRVWFAWG